MFFTECARLAKQSPDLAMVVEQVDAQLAQIPTDGLIRAADMASFLGIDPNQTKFSLGGVSVCLRAKPL